MSSGPPLPDKIIEHEVYWLCDLLRYVFVLIIIPINTTEYTGIF